MAVEINGDGLITVDGTSTTQGRVRLKEDTDNGSNYVELTAPASVTANRTITFPDDTGTVLTNSGNQTGVFSALTVNSNNISADNSLGFRNRIINGAMVIDQRNAGASFTVTGSNYTLDRWLAFTSGSAPSKFSVQQSSVAPAGFTKSLLCTSLSAYSIGAGEICTLNQLIEGYNVADLAFGTASAKSFTFSFWVRSSLTGTFSSFFANSGQSRWYLAPFTINSANTWEYKTITVPGDTGGTWLTDNNTGLYASFQLSVGSNFLTTASTGWSGSSTMYGITGQQSLVGTNGATFYITGVQLEVGSVATPFERRPYGTELALCQRYCFVYSYANTGAAYASLILGRAVSTTSAQGPFILPVPMRITPSITWTGTYSDVDTGASGTVVSINGPRSTNTQVFMNVTYSSGSVTTGNASYVNLSNSTTWSGVFSSEL